MVDTSHIDILSLIERKAAITVVDRKPINVRNFETGEIEREVHSNCPWCPGSQDSFVIQIDKGYYTHAVRSSGCGRHGDALHFLYEWEGTGFIDACEELGISLDNCAPDEIRVRRVYKPEYPPQTKKWRDTAEIKLDLAQALIHNGIGLEYAHSRGLTDGTILDWRLGYVPFRKGTQRFFTLNADEWGFDHDKPYYMYEGLLIPWFIKGKVWKLQVRRISGNFDSSNKILPIKDSIEHCLFNQDAIRHDKPVVLVESALCAISGNQEAGDLATFVATGGTNANRYVHNVSLLACAPVVLVAFDNDQNSAGDKGADYWMKVLPNAFRWLPWCRDMNAMLVEGKDINAWVEIGLASVELEQEDVLPNNGTPDSLTPQPVALAADYNEEEQALLTEVLALAAQMVQPCSACLDEDPPRETPAIGDYEGFMYCAEHMPAARMLTQGEVIERFTAALLGWTVTVEPRITLTAYLRKQHQDRDRGKWITDPSRPRVPDEVWYSIPRGDIWQKMTEEGNEVMQGDYWVETHAKLKQTGYCEQVARDEADFWQRVQTPRTYPVSVPRYELVEVDGSKTVVQVGYWPEQIEQVSA